MTTLLRQNAICAMGFKDTAKISGKIHFFDETIYGGRKPKYIYSE